MKVTAVGRIARLLGGRELQVEMERSTVGDLLQKILQTAEGGESEVNVNSILVSVNGVEVSALQGFSTPLTPSDSVVLIPVVHGG